MKTEAVANDNIYPDGLNGYPTFSDIKSPIMRAWNRLNVVFNMKEFLKNNVMATKYVAQFPKADQFAIAILAAKISKDGYENTRRTIMKENNV